MHELEEFGLGSDLERGVAESLFYHLISEDTIAEFNWVTGFATKYVKLGTNYRDFENWKRQLKIHVRSSPNSRIKPKVPHKASRKRPGTRVVNAAQEDYPTSTNTRLREGKATTEHIRRLDRLG